MRSIFTMGFRAEPWVSPRPGLGQVGAIISSLITAGAGAYQAYEARKAAEEMREAQEAKAAAERARAEAEKARAEAEAKKAAEERQAEQAAAGVPAADGTVLGIPKDYVLYGGIGLGAAAVIGLVVALTAK